MPVATSGPRTLYDKVFDDHLVYSGEGDTLIYIDRHLVHEVTSPQAFEGLRNAQRPVRRPDCTLATVDHNIPTSSRKSFKNIESFIAEPDSRAQVGALEHNVKEFGLTYFGMGDRRQGIVHIIGPEQGFTLPGTTVVCGDSHTSTHGAFGALAFGIGTSEVEHVLATQTLPQKKSKNMRINVEGELPQGCNSKDIVLHIIGLIGTAGGNGAVIEFSGSTIRALSMEARMSICNMSIEGGARAGMIAPDEITFKYLEGRPLAPRKDNGEWDQAVEYWKTLSSDPGAHYDVEVEIRAEDIAPTITWGTSPQDTVAITGVVPNPADAKDPIRKAGMERALQYMGLEPGVEMEKVKIDKAFLGSCTNGRIEDLRSAAQVIAARGKDAKVAEGVYAMVVPGSGLVKQQAEAEGIDVIFKKAGFDWREAGCSMCLGMNPDQLSPQERCASTSNRNFEGRQGAGGRTHLMSPAMVAAAAMTGYLTDVRKILGEDVAEHADIKITQASDYFDVAKAAPNPVAQDNLNGDNNTPLPPRDENASAGLPKFTVLKGIAAPLSIPNVDTDMIIPKQFLKTLERTGLGKAAFFERRYNAATGEENPDFVFNQEPFRNAKILVNTGGNFGCGSSREHAPWALNDFGIRCVLAPSFADIFYNNCFKNGMLPLVLPQEQLEILHADASTGQELEVDLENKVINRPNGQGSIPFNVDDFRRHCLINGLDDIGLTLQHRAEIEEFETRRSATWPWLDGLGYAKKGGKVPTGPVSPPKKQQKMDW